jgi:hypothetical protein
MHLIDAIDNSLKLPIGLVGPNCGVSLGGFVKSFCLNFAQIFGWRPCMPKIEININ